MSDDRQGEQERFIEAWGSMGVLWGINRSMARIHALLLLSPKPIDADAISARLSISRGNVSMCCKELRSWGVIERVNVSGDRRDFYQVVPDMWNMLYRIAIGRKTREFDPALHSLRQLLAEGDLEEGEVSRDRLERIEEIMSTFDSMASRFLASESGSRSIMDFFKTFGPK